MCRESDHDPRETFTAPAPEQAAFTLQQLSRNHSIRMRSTVRVKECRLREGESFPQGLMGGRGRVRVQTHNCLFQNPGSFSIPKSRGVPRKWYLGRMGVRLSSSQKAWDAFGMARNLAGLA